MDNSCTGLVTAARAGTTGLDLSTELAQQWNLIILIWRGSNLSLFAALYCSYCKDTETFYHSFMYSLISSLFPVSIHYLQCIHCLLHQMQEIFASLPFQQRHYLKKGAVNCWGERKIPVQYKWMIYIDSCNYGHFLREKHFLIIVALVW